MHDRRVVITGIGMITPIGHDTKSCWDALKRGQSGIDYITLFEASEFPTKIAGEVKGLSLKSVEDLPGDWKDCGRNIIFAVHAGRQAIKDSGLLDSPGYDPKRCGVYLGAGEGTQDFQHFVHAIAKSLIRGNDEPDFPKFIEEAMHDLNGRMEFEQEPGMSSVHLARLFNAHGPNLSCLTACAASSQAIGEATELIRRGDADAMIAGGTHSMIHPLGITGFNLLTALSTQNQDPKRASRPFDKNRSGFVIAEGSGVIILEEYERAKARGARIYAEVTGYGTTADAFRVTDQHPTGRGAITCMRDALADAGLEPGDIHYINAHGTSTEVNDRVETAAIREVWQEKAKQVPISSTKSMMGHLIAAAGAVELITCLMAMQENVIPPTINYETPDPECDLDYVPNAAREAKLQHVLSNSFGFGGQNVSLVLSRL
ncbi:beta-ketoacyl-ACP synthase II [bacterium]|nr:beta-ketoacyl-ACP synthase II [bacterium]